MIDTINRQFSDKDPGETLVLAFDFGTLSGTIATQVVTATRAGGAADGSPASVILGTATALGGKVAQRVTAGVNGCDYELKCVITTSDGQTLIMVGSLSVRKDRPRNG